MPQWPARTSTQSLSANEDAIILDFCCCLTTKMNGRTVRKIRSPLLSGDKNLNQAAHDPVCKRNLAHQS